MWMMPKGAAPNEIMIKLEADLHKTFGVSHFVWEYMADLVQDLTDQVWLLFYDYDHFGELKKCKEKIEKIDFIPRKEDIERLFNTYHGRLIDRTRGSLSPRGTKLLEGILNDGRKRLLECIELLSLYERYKNNFNEIFSKVPGSIEPRIAAAVFIMNWREETW